MSAMFYFVLIIIGLILFYIYAGMGKLVRCVLFTALTGWCVLLLLGFWGGGLGIDLAVTPLSATIAGVLGMPGVLAMLIFNLM